MTGGDRKNARFATNTLIKAVGSWQQAVGSRVKIASYRDLWVWRHGIRLVKEVYRLTRDLPRFEVYGLCSQMQRAAVSIPANIAEGYGRQHKNEYIRHLTIANG